MIPILFEYNATTFTNHGIGVGDLFLFFGWFTSLVSLIPLVAN